LGYCGISPRVYGLRGIGQVMQLRRERKRQYGPPASIQPAARLEGGLRRCSSFLLEWFQKAATSRGDLRDGSSSPSTICPHCGPALSFASSFNGRLSIAILY